MLHLCVCGVDELARRMSPFGNGASPRVQSGLGAVLVTLAFDRCISACAELNVVRSTSMNARSGTSLRVRSGHCGGGAKAVGPRCISACAERTASLAAGWSSRPVDLCVCGLDTVIASADYVLGGTSPRMRTCPLFDLRLCGGFAVT